MHHDRTCVGSAPSCPVKFSVPLQPAADTPWKGTPMTPRASFRLFRTGLIGSVVLGLAAGGHLGRVS